MLYKAHLIIHNRAAGGGEGDGGHPTDEIPHLVPALHLRVTREGPNEAVDEVAGNVMFQLVELRREIFAP